jgi:hypothetical protein
MNPAAWTPGEVRGPLASEMNSMKEPMLMSRSRRVETGLFTKKGPKYVEIWSWRF